MLTDVAARDASEHIRKLERLLEASRLLNSTLELNELTQIVLRLVREEVPVDRCTLYVVDEQRLRSFVAQGVDEFEINLPLGQGLAGAVAVSGQPLDIEDVYSDPRFRPEVDDRLHYRTNDVLCMPIFNCDGVVTGVLQLLNRSRKLAADDKDFLASICTYLGLALRNAWVHRQLLKSKKTQEELRAVRDRVAHAEKLSAMGELVAGIIHEMRNPLAVALGHCQLLIEETGSDSPIGLRGTKIETSIDRALKVAKNFLGLARGIGADRLPTDINGLIRQTAELLAYEFRVRNATLELGLEELPLTTADHGSIQQVLLNVLKNAHQAASDQTPRGIVSVRSWYDASANKIRIEVADNGPGMPDTVKSRVFEPFFTTKGRESGTGLGLAVSKRIVEGHRGTLSFQSTPGHGTIFVIELPVEAQT